MAYLARLMNVADARDSFVELWARNLPVDGDLDDKLRWFYCDSPVGMGHGFLLHTDVDQPVGCAGIGPRLLFHQGRPLHAGLFADLAVDRGHRTGLPAMQLVDAIVRHADATFDLAYGFPNAKAIGVYRRAGCVELGNMTRYVRVLRSASYFERAIGPGALVHAFAKVADLGLSAIARLEAYRAPRSSELRWLDAFDDRFDRLFRRGRLRHEIFCDRSAEFLSWRFLRNPACAYRIAALVDRETDGLDAYAVLRIIGGNAEIADMFAATDVELDALLRLLVDALDRLGCVSACFRFLGSSRIPRLLARHGFRARDDVRSVILATRAAPKGDTMLLDPEGWYLTDLDEDV